MSRYSEVAEGEVLTWRHRAAITLVNVGGQHGSAGFILTVPPSLDLFWADTRAGLPDVRITAADGSSALPYEIDDYDADERVAVIHVSGVPLSSHGSDVVELAWLYWGQDEAEDASSTVTIDDFLPASIELARPTDPVVAPRPPFVTLTPTERRQVGTSEEIWLWWRVDQYLEQRWTPGYGRRGYEEVRAVTYSMVDDEGSAVTAPVDPTRTRLVEAGRSGFFVGTLLEDVPAGTYTVELLLRTAIGPVNAGQVSLAHHRELTPRCGIAAVDLLLEEI